MPLPNPSPFPEFDEAFNDSAKLRAEIERMRAAFKEIDAIAVSHVAGAAGKMQKVARAALHDEQLAHRCPVCGGHHNIGNPCTG